jgi:hypothetical protein
MTRFQFLLSLVLAAVVAVCVVRAAGRADPAGADNPSGISGVVDPPFCPCPPHAPPEICRKCHFQ